MRVLIMKYTSKLTCRTCSGKIGVMFIRGGPQIIIVVLRIGRAAVNRYRDNYSEREKTREDGNKGLNGTNRTLGPA